MATAATPKGKAVLIGATGAIGSCLFGELLRSKEHFDKVVVFGRNKKAVVPDGYGVAAEEEEASGRLIQHIEDFDELPESKIRELCAGSSVFFSCMGTTRKQAGSAQAFYHIDFELTMKFASAAKAEEVPHFSLVSSMGASPTSWIHYAKTKGQLEEAVKALNFKCLTILRPGLLDRGQERRRFFERISMIVMSGLPVATVAEAMLYNAITVFSSATAPDPPVTVANNTLIRQWASEGTKPVGEKEDAKVEPKAEATPSDSDEQAKPSGTAADESTPAATTEPAPAATTEPTPAATTEPTPAATTEPAPESSPAASTEPAPAASTEPAPAATTEETEVTTVAVEESSSAVATEEKNDETAVKEEETIATAEKEEETTATAEREEETTVEEEGKEETTAEGEGKEEEQNKETAGEEELKEEEKTSPTENDETKEE